MKNTIITLEIKKTIKMMTMNKIKLVLIILSFLTLSACVDTEKNKLDNRVKDFWKFKIDKKFNESYEFLSPGWKKTENVNAYVERLNRSKVNWIKADLIEKKCSETTICDVVIKLSYEYQFKGVASEMVNVDTKITEKWIMKSNIWYNLPKEQSLTN
jgi:hypothetical protein